MSTNRLFGQGIAHERIHQSRTGFTSTLSRPTSSAENLFAIVQEYCRLSKIIDPSDKEIDQLAAILDLTEFDHELGCLINEADHLIAYELGLSTDLPRLESRLREILSESTSATHAI